MKPRRKNKVKALLIDDSAVVRQVMINILEGVPWIDLEVAADPIFALEKMALRRPDVILLDLILPRMDGFQFLEELMARDPIPVVVISGTAQKGSERALRALDLGAVDLVAKPSLNVAGFLRDSADYLADTIRAAAAITVKKRGLMSSQREAPIEARASRPAAIEKPSAPGVPSHGVIAIGASTGGPDRLRILLEGLSPDHDGVIIAQHMPSGFTNALARRLDEATPLRVREARDGDRVSRGEALVAPGDHHIQLVGSPGNFRVRLTFVGPDCRVCPSVDHLFYSVAKLAGPRATGVILSGMGQDGAAGITAMKYAGSRTIAESEQSSTVFGMPRKAIESGGVDHILSKNEIARLLAEAEPTPRSEAG